LDAATAFVAGELVAVAGVLLAVRLIRSVRAVGNGAAEQRSLIAATIAHKVEGFVAGIGVARPLRIGALVDAIFTVVEAVAHVLAIEALSRAAADESRGAIGANGRRSQLGDAVASSAVEREPIGTATYGAFRRVQTHSRTLGLRTGTGCLGHWLSGHIEDPQICSSSGSL